MKNEKWISLFSGGKDSNWSLYQAIKNGLDVEFLVTVHPPQGSYMYHFPATRVVPLAAESIGIELIEIEPKFEIDKNINSSKQGDLETKFIEMEIEKISEKIELTGVIVGAVESEYQASRIQNICDKLDIELYAPLWKIDPIVSMKNMIKSGFEMMIVGVAAMGFDESWLGRYIDIETISDLEILNEKYGVHVMGEGGEYETIVTNGPHMNLEIKMEYETVWDVNSGEIKVKNAWLI